MVTKYLSPQNPWRGITLSNAVSVLESVCTHLTLLTLENCAVGDEEAFSLSRMVNLRYVQWYAGQRIFFLIYSV